MSAPQTPIYDESRIPVRKVRTEFAEKTAELLTYIAQTHVPGMNEATTFCNAKVTETEIIKNETKSYAQDASLSVGNASEFLQISSSNAHFVGVWAGLSGELSVPSSCYHDGKNWQLLYNVALVQNEEPGVSAAWSALDTIRLIRTPIPMSPNEGDTEVSPSPELQASSFACIYSSIYRIGRRFQIDVAGGDFTTPVYDHVTNSNYHTAGAFLNTNSNYKWRCRDEASESNVSQWSEVVNFKTGVVTIKSPELTVSGAPSSVPKYPTFTASSFETVPIGEDTHHSTDWQVLSEGIVIWESLQDEVNKLFIELTADVMSQDSTSTFRVRFNGNNHGQSGWSTVEATTLTLFPSGLGSLRVDMMDDTWSPPSTDYNFGAFSDAVPVGTGFIVCGRRHHGQGEGLLFRFDGSLNVLWQRHFNETPGHTQMERIQLYGESVWATAGSSGAYLTKWDFNGNLLIQKALTNFTARQFIVQGDNIYAHGINSNNVSYVCRLSASDASPVWGRRFGANSGQWTSGQIAADASTIYIVGNEYEGGTTDHGYIIRLNQSNGSILWQKKTLDIVFQSCVFVNGMLYVTGFDWQDENNLRLLCIDTDGDVVWTKKIAIGVSANGARLYVKGDNLYLSIRQFVALLNLNGQLQWTTKIENSAIYGLVTIDEYIYAVGMALQDAFIVQLDDDGTSNGVPACHATLELAIDSSWVESSDNLSLSSASYSSSLIAPTLSNSSVILQTPEYPVIQCNY